MRTPLPVTSESLCADPRCEHPQGWHYRGTGSCLECGCMAFEAAPLAPVDRKVKSIFLTAAAHAYGYRPAIDPDDNEETND